MTKTEILTEIARLRAYKLDLERNLPKAVLEHDTGYKVSLSRIEELETMLKDEEKVEEKIKIDEAAAIAESAKLLPELKAEIQKFTADMRVRAEKLHRSHAAQINEKLSVLESIDQVRKKNEE